MIRAVRPYLPRPNRVYHRLRRVRLPLPTPPAIPPEPAPYDRRFWFACAANTVTVIGSALLYRYADFVTVLGGSEMELGWIIGFGTIGSLVARLFLGAYIDRSGPRRMWLAGLLLVAGSCLLHPWIDTAQGPGIYLTRLAYCLGLAAVFSASVSFVAGRVSRARVAEMIGMIGAAGFAGTLVGPHLGDWIAATAPDARVVMDRLFVVSGLLTLAAVPLAWLSTRYGKKPIAPPQRRESPWRVMYQYSPAPVIIAAAVIGAALAVPYTFLAAYAGELKILRLGTFFTVYSTAAILARVFARKSGRRLDPTAMTVVGIGSMALGLLCLLPVQQGWHLLFAAAITGFGHGIVYPFLTATGTSRFPEEHRGLGTTLMIAAFDLGLFIGAPIFGAVLAAARSLELPRYPTLFVVIACVLLLAGAGYAWAMRGMAEEAEEPEELPQGELPWQEEVWPWEPSSDGELPTVTPAPVVSAYTEAAEQPVEYQPAA